MIDSAAASTAKEELQALSRVQSEMELSAKRVSAARAKLSDVRAGRHNKQAA